MNKQFNIVVYHDSCPDGIASLWAVKRHLPNIQVASCKAGNVHTMDLEMFADKCVIFVDICPNMDTLESISGVAQWVTILDHHKSALDDYEKYHGKKASLGQIYNNVEIYFDMSRAGCQMTWDYFNPSIAPDKTRPWFVNYIADRDLWQWKLPYSKEYNTAFYDLKYLTPDKINLLYEMDNKTKETIKQYGIDTLIKFNTEVNNHCLNAIISMAGEYKCWLLSCGYEHRSEVGNKLSQIPFPDGSMPDFTAIWTSDPKSNDKWISLRNTSNLDLGIVCKSFDIAGGGHPRAAGFTIHDNDLSSVFENIETPNIKKYLEQVIMK